MMYELFELDALKRGRAEGRAQGRAEGEAKGIVKTLVQLVRDGLLDLSEASRRANMSEQEFAALVASR